LEQHNLIRLTRGCKKMGIYPDQSQLEHLQTFQALLARWNNTFNLTAVRDEGQVVTRHLLDSLSVLPHLDPGACIDVGTGAGLPGIPLAIMRPEQPVHLLDSNGKKTRFLFQVKTALSLDNIVVHQARVERFQPDSPFVSVISRAFASLQEMVRGCRHLVAPGGRLLAMKGAPPDRELQACASERIDAVVHALNVPDLDEQRHLVEIRLQPG
jgi:16S rRNA (guanine527-N7)-methyltransferase